jgi:hypothetical protein
MFARGFHGGEDVDASRLVVTPCGLGRDSAFEEHTAAPSRLKMEAACSSETLVSTDASTRCYNADQLRQAVFSLQMSRSVCTSTGFQFRFVLHGVNVPWTDL